MAAFSNEEPYDHGMLDTGDGNLVYWETRGNPDGRPVLIVHGGPGAGSPTGTPKSFDPQHWRIVLFDQRGCGRSTPHASDPATGLGTNTSEHLLRDMEQLREHLGVRRWMLFGGSWGSGLSLAYAERHPDQVTGLLLVAFATMGRSEVDWLYRRGGVQRFFPEQWARFRDVLPEAERGGDPVAAYARLMEDPDPGARATAAVAWAAWEDAVLSLETAGRPNQYGDRPSDALLAFVRICAHYAAHHAWWEDGALLRDAGRLAGIPGVIVHGRRDLSCPVGNAWDVARAWPGAELVVVEDAGHKGSPAMAEQIQAALRRLAAA